MHFMTLTIHYIDPFTWTLHSDLLDMHYLPTSHTAENIAHQTVTRLEAALPADATHVCCSTDNAPNMVRATRIMHYGWAEASKYYYEEGPDAIGNSNDDVYNERDLTANVI
jgi:hypothetical protein